MRANVRRYAQAYLDAAAGASAKDLPMITKRFIAAITRRRQRKLLPKILAALGPLWNAEHNIDAVEVTVAREIDPSVVKRAFGSKAEVTVITDPSIIGGAIIDRGDTRLDASLRASLNRLRTALVRKD